MAVLCHCFKPGACLGIVAVDQRAIDVENHAAYVSHANSLQNVFVVLYVPVLLIAFSLHDFASLGASYNIYCKKMGEKRKESLFWPTQVMLNAAKHDARATLLMSRIVPGQVSHSNQI